MEARGEERPDVRLEAVGEEVPREARDEGYEAEEVAVEEARGGEARADGGPEAGDGGEEGESFLEDEDGLCSRGVWEGKGEGRARQYGFDGLEERGREGSWEGDDGLGCLCGF